MGSFSEVVLGFHFRRDTPPEVLAAFAGLAGPADAARTDIAQPLPEPVEEPDADWAPDLMGEQDPDPAPWRHDWAAWLGSSMSVGICPSATLRWAELGRWYLSCRAGFKSTPAGVHEFLRWLAPYVGDGLDGEGTRLTSPPLLLGYVKHEYLERPNLLWLRDGAIELDGPDPEAPVGVLEVVCGLPGSGREEYLATLRREGWPAFDGYHASAVDNDPHPLNSRFAGAVLRGLESGDLIRVSDVAFCADDRRERLIAELRHRLPEARIRVVSFADDPEQCRRNVLARAAHEPGHDVAFELAQLEHFAAGYRPAGDVRPVSPWTPPAGS